MVDLVTEPYSVVVLVGGVAAMLGALLNLILGLSRVSARDGSAQRHARGVCPSSIIALPLRPRSRSVLCPSYIIVGVGDLAIAWSFSAFTILLYYGITNLSALALDRRRWTASAGADLVRRSLVLRASEGLGHRRCPRISRFGLAGASPRLKPDIGTLTPVPPMKHVFRLLLCALTACSVVVGETPTETISVATTTTSSTTSTTLAPTPVTTSPPQRVCTPLAGGTAPIATGSAAGDALALSREIFPCSDHAVVVAENNLDEVAVAAQLAAALGAPLLHPHPELARESGAARPLTVHLMGAVEVATPADAGLLRAGHPRGGRLSPETPWARLGDVPLPPVPDASTVVETIRGLTTRDRAVVPPAHREGNYDTTVPAEPVIEPRPLSSEGSPLHPGPDSPGWFPASQPVSILSAAATGGPSVLRWWHRPGQRSSAIQ